MNDGKLSKQLLELIYRQAGIANNTAHCKGIDGVIAWNGDNANTVGYYYVFASANDSESGFSSALTASRWLMPGILGTTRPLR